jgi:hypothetical protein
MPEYTGLWNSSGILQRTGQTYNYPSVSNQTITLTCTSVHTANGFDYCYGCPTVSLAGVMFFIGDWISELVGNKLASLFTLLYFFITPANFNIQGFTISDLSGVALMLVIGAYGISYLLIGVLAYKIISPFTGVG